MRSTLFGPEQRWRQSGKLKLSALGPDHLQIQSHATACARSPGRVCTPTLPRKIAVLRRTSARKTWAVQSTPILSDDEVGVPSKHCQVHRVPYVSYDFSYCALRVPLFDKYMTLAQSPSNPEHVHGTKSNGRRTFSSLIFALWT